VTPSQLNTCPYSFAITLPTFSIAAYGLLLLASRQTRWSTSPDSLIPTLITQTIPQAIPQQTPATVRSKTDAPKLSRDTYSITSLAFAGHRPTECYRIFRSFALHTLPKLVTTAEYRYQHERPTSDVELSPPLQALLQVLDAIQPATRWAAEERPNTMTFTPLDVDYNPFRLQSMHSSLYLTHPEDPNDLIKYLVRPPRLRSDLRGTPTGHLAGALRSWCSLPPHCLFLACPHMTQILPKATSCKHYSGVSLRPFHISHPPTRLHQNTPQPHLHSSQPLRAYLSSHTSAKTLPHNLITSLYLWPTHTHMP